MQRETKSTLAESVFHGAVLIGLAVLLMPILLGSTLEIEKQRREYFRAMRAEHMARLAADRERIIREREERRLWRQYR
jgi:hypothetical protein